MEPPNPDPEKPNWTEGLQEMIGLGLIFLLFAFMLAGEWIQRGQPGRTVMSPADWIQISAFTAWLGAMFVGSVAEWRRRPIRFLRMQPMMCVGVTVLLTIGHIEQFQKAEPIHTPGMGTWYLLGVIWWLGSVVALLVEWRARWLGPWTLDFSLGPGWLIFFLPMPMMIALGITVVSMRVCESLFWKTWHPVLGAGFGMMIAGAVIAVLIGVLWWRYGSESQDGL